MTAGPGRESVVFSDQTDDADHEPRPRTRPGGRNTDEFAVGCVVRHPRFGLGRVESIMRRASGAAARIAFPTAGTKTLILDYAPLERVDQ